MSTILSRETCCIGAAATLLALGSYYLLTKHYYGERYDDDNSEYLELLVGEEKGLINASSISTVTFYQGDITKSFDIYERVSTIISKNTWLASQLVYRRINGERRLVAKYPKQVNPADFLLYYTERITGKSENIPKEDESWESINEQLKSFIVKKGVDCINKRFERLFNVAVIRKVDPTTLEVTHSALIVSLSHVLGDGHTFYSLYRLLDPRTPSSDIPSFTAQRFMDFPTKIDEIYGKSFQEYLQSIPFLCSVLITIFCRRKPNVTLFNINSNIIQTIKQNYLKQNQQEYQSINSSLASKLSTNDIITSWYFRTCACDIGIMAVNFRGKLENYTNQHAGNYAGMIFYSPSDYRSALDIRQSIGSFRSNSNPIPSFYTTLKYRFSCISNWSSFYHHLVFPTAIHRVHLPLYDLSNSIFRDMAIIFTPREHELSLCLLTRSDLPQSKLFQSSGFLTTWKSENE